MRTLEVAGRWLQGRKTRAVASVLSVVVLLAVPALALAHLGADAFSFWTAEDGASRATLPEGLLPFDGPAATVSVQRAIAEDARQTLAAAKPADEVTVVRNWQYTQNIDPAVLAAAPILYNWWVFFNTGGATPTTQFKNILTAEFTYDVLVSGSISLQQMERLILVEYLLNQLFLHRSASTSATPWM
jgi:hypothetical protein